MKLIRTGKLSKVSRTWHLYAKWKERYHLFQTKLQKKVCVGGGLGERNVHLARKMRGIKAARFLVVPLGSVKSGGLYFMFCVSFSNNLKLKREKVEEFKFRKKDKRAFGFHFGFFTSNLQCSTTGKGEDLCNLLRRWKPGLNRLTSLGVLKY